jgi:hypothetical protein
MIDTIRDEQNTLLGFAKITRDISEQKAINDRIAWMALRCVDRFYPIGWSFLNGWRKLIALEMMPAALPFS